MMRQGRPRRSRKLGTEKRPRERYVGIIATTAQGPGNGLHQHRRGFIDSGISANAFVAM